MMTRVRGHAALSGPIARALAPAGRVLRRLTHPGESTEFATAGPPERVSPALLESVLAQKFGLARPAEVAQRLDLPDGFVTDSPYRGIDAPLMYEQAWLLAVAVSGAVARSRRGLVKGVRETSVGFVESPERRVEFGAIFYVSLPRLLQRAPLYIAVGTLRIPVVLRAFQDIDTTGHRFHGGLITSVARLGDEVGALTAAHVVGDKNRLAPGDEVACEAAPEEAPCCHRVIASDRVMDAALVDDGSDANGMHAVHATGAPGYFPVEVEGPLGPTPGQVFEIAIPQGVIPGDRGVSPTAPAQVFINVVGEPGWSGAMVRETLYRDTYGSGAPPNPYGMFVGVRDLFTGRSGRVHMLHQHEVVWGLELLDGE